MALRWGQGITYKIFTLKDQERFIVYESGIEIWLEDTLYADFFPKWENVPAVRKIGYILYALVKVTRSCWKWRVQVEAFTALRETFYEDCKLLSAQNMWIVLNITGCLSSISCFLAIICGDWCNHFVVNQTSNYWRKILQFNEYVLTGAPCFKSSSKHRNYSKLSWNFYSLVADSYPIDILGWEKIGCESRLGRARSHGKGRREISYFSFNILSQNAPRAAWLISLQICF